MFPIIKENFQANITHFKGVNSGQIFEIHDSPGTKHQVFRPNVILKSGNDPRDNIIRTISYGFTRNVIGSLEMIIVKMDILRIHWQIHDQTVFVKYSARKLSF